MSRPLRIPTVLTGNTGEAVSRRAVVATNLPQTAISRRLAQRLDEDGADADTVDLYIGFPVGDCADTIQLVTAQVSDELGVADVVIGADALAQSGLTLDYSGRRPSVACHFMQAEDDDDGSDDDEE